MNPLSLGGDIPEWSLAERLIKARTHATLNRQELANALGVSERTIKRYEGGYPYKRGIVLGWAMACGVDPNWLVGGTPGDPHGDLGVATLRYVRRQAFTEPTNLLVAA